ncbi:MAG: anti-sigma factor antagonist [Bacteroidetes bacterium]|nr:MAG: anti-sigma factor antagonist [Bacteroidota bacterium]
MRFSIDRQDNIAIFTLKDKKLDAEIAPQLKAELLILCQPELEALIFDMSQVEHVDSTGLGALLLANRQLKDNEAPIILVGVQEMVMKMLSISQLDTIFDYDESVEDALEYLKDGN